MGLIHASLPLPPPGTNLGGKVVVIIGGTRGIGFEALKHFIKLKPQRIILGCRDTGKGLIVAAVARSTFDLGYDEINIDVWEIDLESFDSVKKFAQQFRKEGIKKIDILVENAAILTTQFAITRDGWEKSMQTNYLSPALLAFLLLPLMSHPPAPGQSNPRIIVVSSEAHSNVRDLPESRAPGSMLQKLNDESNGRKLSSRLGRYALTKLLEILFVEEFNLHLRHPRPTIIAVHPGFCKTDLFKEWASYPIINIFVWLILFLFTRTAEMGSRTIIHAALSGKEEDVRGKYMVDCKVAKPKIKFEMSGVRKRLWDETVATLSEVDPSIPQLVNEYTS